jgi:hypothetical protein
MAKINNISYVRSFVFAAITMFIVALCLPISGLAKDLEPGEITFPLEEFAIITEFDMDIPGGFSTATGHVCSRQGNIDLGGTSQIVRLPFDAPTNLDWNTMAATGDVNCNKNTVLGDVRGNLNVNASTCRVGFHNATPIPCADNPPFPSFTASTNPLDDIVCTRLGTDIVPGTYRYLLVEKDGRCNFRGPGEYNFELIQSGRRGNAVFSFLDMPPICDKFSPVIINVKSYVLIAEDNKFNVENIEPVYINIEGPDNAFKDDPVAENICPFGLDDPTLHSVFCHRGDGVLNVCRIHAPQGTVALRGALNARGQILSKHFEDVRGLPVRVTPPDADCCFDTPECACIISFSNFTNIFKGQTAAVGETVLIRGQDFNRSTVDKVIFVSTSAPNVDVSSPAGVCEVMRTDPGFTFVNNTSIEVVVPAGCPADNYFLGIANGAVCVKTDIELTVTP